MSDTVKEKVVLAYSGGLDTSCILKWLLDKDYEVYCFIANVGQEEDFEAARQKAIKIGAKDVFVEDLRREFVSEYIFPALQANSIYESRYLLGTSLARPVIARHQVRIAHQVGAKVCSHGATGKGNDQVRFELSIYALDPTLRILAPWRIPEFFTRFQGRSDLIQYAQDNGIPVPVTRAAPYSMDENLYHISYESGVLEDPAHAPTPDMFRMTRNLADTPNDPDRIRISFKDGCPVEVLNHDSGKQVTDALDIMLYLNELGKKHGIGRIDIVENRFVGIKSRGVYETPGGTILRAAHLDIEGIAMDREVMRLRDILSPLFAEKTYNGFWFSPEMDFLRAAIQKSQEFIDGSVELVLFKGHPNVVGRSSPTSLYDQDLASMDIAGGFNPSDSEGFIRINAIRLKAHRAILTSISKTQPDRFKATEASPSFTDIPEKQE
eukprot:TRINITY_DN93_c0_g1_i13.p2 TRINITY_DN93_c0_g1~~TRINITY_DN93_c0_g1_i13.p2  ORF type:complete len:437 (-),score=90.84 TRINITY_DN93_c0_g1_i13:1919-3229(-)